MTSKDNVPDNAPDQELLERYRRASDAQAVAPSDAVRAAILAEGRRAAKQHATEVSGRVFDASRPAANDSRWKITAFGTAGAALVAALLFAPRLWEGMPPAPAVSNTTTATSADKAAPAESGAAPRSRKAGAHAQSAAPAEKMYPQNYAEGVPPNDAKAAPQAAPPGSANAPAAPTAPALSSLSAARVAGSRNIPQPAALLSAAASGDMVRTTALLEQGAALETRDGLGRTPLMLAVMQRKPEVVRLLLSRGADPNVADSSGRTPLQQAKQKNFSEIAAMLARAGAR